MNLMDAEKQEMIGEDCECITEIQLQGGEVRRQGHDARRLRLLLREVYLQ